MILHFEAVVPSCSGGRENDRRSHLARLAVLVGVAGESRCHQRQIAGKNAIEQTTVTAASPDDDEVAKPPAFVYAVLITLFATFLVFPVIHGIRIAKKNDGTLLDNEKDDFVVLNESAYAFASFASKIPLLILFRFGVSARSDSVVLVDPLGDPSAIRNASLTKTGSEPADASALAGSTALVSFAVGIVSLLLIRRAQRTANNPNASWF